MTENFRYTVWIVIDPDIQHEEASIVLDKPRTYETTSPLNLVVQIVRWMEKLEKKWPFEEMAAWISHGDENLVMSCRQAVGLDHLDKAKEAGIDIDDDLFQHEYEWMISRASTAMANGIGPRS